MDFGHTVVGYLTIPRLTLKIESRRNYQSYHMQKKMMRFLLRLYLLRGGAKFGSERICSKQVLTNLTNILQKQKEYKGLEGFEVLRRAHESARK